MTLIKITARIVPMLLSALPVGLAAQPISTAPPGQPVPPPSPAWTITTNEGSKSVQIAATATGGTTQLILACKAGQDGLSGGLARYQGGGLRTDGEVEALSVFAEGTDWRDAFSIRVRYIAANRTWVLANPLSPVFLGSFSRGAKLTVVNSRNQEILNFDLTGSTAATRAMRGNCSFPSQPG